MKKTLKQIAGALVVLLAFTAIAKAQEPKMDNWKELKAYHNVMAQTYHPMESGDFGPIKKQSAELASRAKALAASTIPAEYANDQVKSLVQQIASQSGALDEMIKKSATDDAIKSALTELHTTFHKLLGLINKDHKEGGAKPAKQAGKKAQSN